jgi:hypothetical protein
MPARKQINAKKLLKAVESKRNSKDIMAEFGIKTQAQLKSMYVDALVAQGRISAIVRSRGRKKADGSKKESLRINKRGSLIVPREIVEQMGFAIGDSFAVKKTAAGVSLKKA